MSRIKSTLSSSNTKLSSRPSLTPEARESKLISLAMDLAERHLLEGTASSQEITYFLKLGSSNYLEEKKKLENENALLEAKVKNLESQTHSQELYENAIKAFSSYRGGVRDDNEEQ